MKFGIDWLKEWVDPGLDAAELGARLTMAGLELDSIEPAAPAFSGVVVGEVTSMRPHPNADKLRLCEVAHGEGSSPVVCGAANVAVGMRAPLATVGAQLPGGLKIKRAKLRGEESLGMLCSAKELGLAETADGLMALPGDAPVGEDLRAYLGLDDQVLEVDLTPNRADCLSIAGIAREAAALTGVPLSRDTRPSPVPAGSDERVEVVVEDPAACPRYAGRVLRGIDPERPSPIWLQERLRRCGVRSLGAVVDVTNYVMLELGQPMHAFDRARIEGGIRVRQARAGESLTLLDGQTVELEPGTLVIADAATPVALAGIMGGAESAVGPATRDILLESACFAPLALAGRARAYGLHTESSHRFERGVDPGLQVAAIERATGLLLEIVGGVAGPVIDVGGPAAAADPIALRRARLDGLIGKQIEDAEVEGILSALGCALEAAPQGWSVTPPSYRYDLGQEVDLIEEVARVHGYARIPSRRRSYTLELRPRDESAATPRRLRGLLVDRGYREAVTYSFVEPARERAFAEAAEPLRLANPLSDDLSVMRSTLWPGLLRAVQHNRQRQQDRVRLFEIGRAFVPGDDGLAQPLRLAGVASGPVQPEQWGEPARMVDFFDLKGDVEAVLGLAGLLGEAEFEVATRPGLHPARTAAVRLKGRLLGWVGMLHPEQESGLDLSAPTGVFELDIAAIRSPEVPKFSEISKFPGIRRDLAMVLDAAVSVGDLQACVRAEAGEALQDIYVFDVYTGKGVPKGRKSIAFGLILQDLSRTLTDQEVEQIVRRIVSRCERDLGATLRI